MAVISSGCLLATAFSTGLHAQEVPSEQIFFRAKVFTGNPNNLYAEAVAIRDGMILAVGNLAEVSKAASSNAKRTDLEGKSLFPGFIDSHSHSIDGGLSLISADITDKVDTLDRLPAFVDQAKKDRRGMRGDILEVSGMPLEFWSHLDTLNADFSTNVYENQSVLLRGMDGHTSWANRALLARAGITREFLQKLTEQQRSYYGVDNNMQPNAFLVDAGGKKVEALLPPYTQSHVSFQLGHRPRNIRKNQQAPTFVGAFVDLNSAIDRPIPKAARD